MIYFQLDHCAALGHMVLSIKLATTEYKGQSSEPLRQMKKATQSNLMKKGREEAESVMETKIMLLHFICCRTEPTYTKKIK